MIIASGMAANTTLSIARCCCLTTSGAACAAWIRGRRTRNEQNEDKTAVILLSSSQLPSGVFRVPMKRELYQLAAEYPVGKRAWVSEGEAAAKMKLYARFDDSSVVYADELEGGGEVRATHGGSSA
jgi:hypothetical protein